MKERDTASPPSRFLVQAKVWRSIDKEQAEHIERTLMDERGPLEGVGWRITELTFWITTATL